MDRLTAAHSGALKANVELVNDYPMLANPWPDFASHRVQAARQMAVRKGQGM